MPALAAGIEYSRRNGLWPFRPYLIRSRMMRVSALFLLALLAGCGQKGPLYFAPDKPEQPAAEQPVQAPADNAQQDDDQQD